MSLTTNNRPPNSSDVAQRAGVSRATVSYVFNGRRDGATVPDATRQRVLAAAEEIGYRPNRTARALKTGKTNTIALWAASFATPYYASVLGHVEDMAHRDGYEVVVSTSNNIDVLDSAHLPADGMIVIDKQSIHFDAMQRVQFSMPLVSMGAYFTRSLDHVGVDLYSGTKTAMAHLYARGKRRIAYLSFGGIQPIRHSINQNLDLRLVAYIETVQARGEEPQWIIAEDDGRRVAYEAFRSFWERTKRDAPHRLPDALLCLDDILAIGAMHYLREAGISLPDSVAVVGCDGIEEGEFHHPPLTTIVQPVAEISRLSWEFLRRRIQEPHTPLQSAILTPTLALRGSA